MSDLVQFVLSAKDTTGAAFGTAREGLNRLGEQVISVRGLMASLLGVFSVGAFAAGVKSAAEAADAAAKMGDRFGIATDKLIGMQHGAQLAGASNEALAQGLKAMATVAIDAARGGEESARAFGVLGIRAQEFINLPMDRQLTIVVERLGEVENATLRNEVANKVLGKSYGELMGLVAEGSESFRQATEDARAWGLAISRVDAAKLEMANDAITRAQKAAQGLFTTIAIQLAPIVKALADLWSDNAREARGFRQEVSFAMEKAIVGVAHTINMVRGLEFAYQAVRLGVAVMGEVTFQVLDFIVEKLRMVGNIASYLPGPLGIVGRVIKESAGLAQGAFGEMARSMGNVAAEIREKMDELAERGLIDPDKLVAKVRGLATAMEKEAETIAASREKFMAAGEIDIPRDKDQIKPGGGREDFRQALRDKLARLSEEHMTEQELLRAHLVERQLIVQEAIDDGLLSEQAAATMSEQIQLQHQAKMGNVTAQGMLQRRQIESMNLRQQGEFYFGQLASITSAAAQHSKKMFTLNKIANIANAIMSTYAGAAKALEWGFPLGPIFAAIILAAGLANVAAIRAQQFEGGGATAPATAVFSANPNTGLPTASGTRPEPPELPGRGQVAIERVANINIFADRETKTTYGFVVDEILPALEQAVANGATRLNVQLLEPV